MFADPPIEIGGYKYVVPNGTARKNQLFSFLEIGFGHLKIVLKKVIKMLKILRGIKKRQTPQQVETCWGVLE